MRFCVFLVSWLIFSHQFASANEILPRRTFSLQGEGRVSAQPDMAVVELSIVTQAPQAQAAASTNARAADALMRKMKELGVAPQDLATLNYSIQPEVVYDSQGAKQPRISGYRVENTVQVKVRDLAKISAVLDGAIGAGSNQIGALRFERSDVVKHMEEARRLAVRDALAKAKLYAAELNEPLGSVVSLQESGGDVPQPKAMAMESMSMRGAAVATPVQQGELTWIVRVDVQFALGK